MSNDADVIVIGGGFFGMYIAEHFSKQGSRVILLEKDQDFMQRASFVNQARVHNGYHYPRSILTALRSSKSFPRFVHEFKDCIDDSFEKYYMIGKLLSNVTARQFALFCNRIGLPCDPATSKITSLVNPQLIDAVFSTTEYAFDAVKLKQAMLNRLELAGVDCRLGIAATRVQRHNAELIVESFDASLQADIVFSAKQVLNCSYSMTNNILANSDIDRISLKHELTEMCLIEVPDELKHVGITVMCGPFFSVMPFPSAGLHSLSHVRYTPHFQWYDSKETPYLNAHDYFENISKKSNWRKMILDASRYLPILNDSNFIKSIWEVKTILPHSESDDSRPILFKPNYGLPGLHTVMGGKIDNVYDIVHEIDKQ
ncbi:MAG: FAD-binding oxidoreductase [Gammaproteobacteria bacterium]|nr:FAD-binding oxidoreductase [Gammaproteobacteria bacterium]